MFPPTTFSATELPATAPLPRSASDFAAVSQYDALLWSAVNARQVLVLTGPGMSASSGLQPFPVKSSLNNDILDDPSIDVLDLFTRPEDVAGWHRRLHELAAAAVPNAGHWALARSQNAIRDAGGQLTVVTTNVDDLHEAAGVDVHHLHGRVSLERCLRCRVIRPAAHLPNDQCGLCGGMMRTGAVLRGEDAHEEATAVVSETFREATAVYVIGETGSTRTSWSLPEMARRAGAITVLIDKDIDLESDYSQLFNIVVNDSVENLEAYLPRI